MQRVNSSTNFSIIAVRDGESGKAIATGDTYESLGNKKVREWLSRRSGTSPRGDDAEGITILVDQTASKAGTVGRNTQEPEERKGANGEVLFEHSVPESKPPEVASDILKHSTISRDQSSANKHLVEDLSLLTKPANNSVQGIDAKLEDSHDNFDYPARYPQSSRSKVLRNPLSSLRDGLARHQSVFEVSAPQNAKIMLRLPRTYSFESKEPSTQVDYTTRQNLIVGDKPRVRIKRNMRSAKVDSDHSHQDSERNGRSSAGHFNDKSDYEDSGDSSFEGRPSITELYNRLEELERENRELKQEVPDIVPPLVPHYDWRTFHCIAGSNESQIFLEPPQWMEGEGRPVLRANMPLRNVEFYLEQHPEIAFIFYKDYYHRPPSDMSQILSKDGVYRSPEPYKQSLLLQSDHIISAVEKLEEHLPEFSDLFPDFDATKEIPAPYMFIYYCLPLLEECKHHLTPLEYNLLNQLIDSIIASHGKEYTDAKNLSAKGMVSKRLLKYLIRPGDILIYNKGSVPLAFMATSWAMEVHGAENIEDDETTARRSRKGGSKQGMSFQGPKRKTYSWDVSAWNWAFDGSFGEKKHELSIRHSVIDEDDVFKINSLDYFPLEYSKDGLRKVLERRGTTFWKCRFKNYVSYQEDDQGALSSIGERYMIDISTYKTLHPESASNREDIVLEPVIDARAMANDDPPEGDSLLLFPPTFTGFNLRSKRWLNLYVDRVSDISWNKQAFESLVVNEKTKELVQALITNQLTAEKSTDLIRGKGNGLTILLHGGPGTGKTFTAEGVAEIAEKPLYRVTCGDVGTKPEEVEKYLEAALTLGKIWDCVVLLDEADVFLEERGLADLQRNALVSVFLRVLEYNVGILILTSNRVGTFDEAFKSRIQLALHYKNLTASQQRKIWRNFLSRLKNLDEDNVDFEDIIDHIDELGKENMNGRQIRNAITTARQLAQYKDKKFCYEHLKHVIEVSGEFENYLKDLRDGFSDDQIKREGGLRL